MKLSTESRRFHFNIRHIILIFVVTLLFLAVSSYVNTLSKNKLFSRTTDIYRKNSIENLADLTATSLELLLEQVIINPDQYSEKKQNTIHGFDMILSQQTLRENIKEICVLIYHNDAVFAIDNGNELYSHFVEGKLPPDFKQQIHQSAIEIFRSVEDKIQSEEDIYSFTDEDHIFHIIVPMMLEGEYSGALYMIPLN